MFLTILKLSLGSDRYAKFSGWSRLTLMVEPDNLEALVLYKKLGFEAFKEAIDLWDGRAYSVICLEKHLNGNSQSIEVMDTRISSEIKL